MCGRYTISHSTEEILERFNVLKEQFESATPNYNVAPSHVVPVILNKSEGSEPPARVLQPLKWGLIPFWVRDPKQKPIINARSETLITKPSFKSAFARRRCIIPADGFYEWKKSPDGKKIPMRIKLPGDQLFGLAGIYEDWKAPDGTTLRTCAIITVEPNQLMESIHNRMPAILTRENEDIWLDSTLQDLPTLAQLLKPYEHELEAFAVSPLVNKVSSNNAECIIPAELLVATIEASDTHDNQLKLTLT